MAGFAMTESNVLYHESTDKRHENRFFVSDTTQIPIRVQRSTDDQNQFIEGALSDLSPGGAKLLLSECLQVAENDSIRITIEELKTTIDVSGEICWSRPADDDKGHAGFSFNPRIDPDLLTQLANKGVIERRGHGRRVSQGSIQVYRELDAEPFDVELTDYSINGFCMETPTACHPGQRLRLCAPSDDGEQIIVAGKVRWNLGLRDRYVVGCAMNNPAQYEVLHQFAKAHGVGENVEQTDGKTACRTKPQLSRPAVGALVTMIAALLAIAVAFYQIFDFGELGQSTAQLSASTRDEEPLSAGQSYSPATAGTVGETQQQNGRPSSPELSTPVPRPTTPRLAPTESPPIRLPASHLNSTNSEPTPVLLRHPTPARPKPVALDPVPDSPGPPDVAHQVTRPNDFTTAHRSTEYTIRTQSLRSPNRRSTVKVTELVFADENK